MPVPFEALEDRLLRGGIAPRHVKRYLRELSEHLADLTQAEVEAGFGADDAAARARAALGPDAELADAMLKQRDFRSWRARFPWLVFLLMPPLALIAGFVLCTLVMVLVGVSGGAIIPHRGIPLPVPGWYAGTASSLMFAANFLVAPLLAFLLAWMAARQRMKPFWPLLGMALILMLNMHGMVQADAKYFSIGLGNVLTFHSGKGPFGSGHIVNWPTFLGQAALLWLPLAWLLWTRRRLAKFPIPY
jgi:hypothetical protein